MGGERESSCPAQAVEENLLDTVIGLPEKLFYGTGIPAAILVFRKNKKDDKVLFIDASRDFEAGKNQNYLREADLQRILTTAFTRQGSDKYAHLASPAEIVENDFNLNIPGYVDTFEEEAPIDLMAVRKERKELKAELARLEAHIKNVFEDGELQPHSVVANFATTAADGKTYPVDHYSLDVYRTLDRHLPGWQDAKSRLDAMTERLLAR